MREDYKIVPKTLVKTPGFYVILTEEEKEETQGWFKKEEEAERYIENQIRLKKKTETSDMPPRRF
jgi:hypothetical protein